MEDQDALAGIIGRNITRLRKIANLTQLELAEKLNYSDKSISKWEQGNGIPDIRILMQIAEMFGVTLDDLVHEHEKEIIMPKKTRLAQRLILLCCSAGLCWLVATVLFVFLGILGPNIRGIWLAYIYAIPASAIVVLVFSCIWKWKVVRIVSISALVWSLLACVYLTAFLIGENIWLIFIIGVPLQILALFYFVFRKGAHFRDRD